MKMMFQLDDIDHDDLLVVFTTQHCTLKISVHAKHYTTLCTLVVHRFKITTLSSIL